MKIETEAFLSEIEKILKNEAQQIMDFWLCHGPDDRFGGFHGTLDRTGLPVPPYEKTLIQQARHLWTLSSVFRHSPPSNSEKIKQIAYSTYQFIEANMLDKDGEFIFETTRDGEASNTKKQLYAEGFAIYALSEFALAFNHQEAKELALTCFYSLDNRCHDSNNLGYDQNADPGWLPQGAGKETNTHIHLLEAFTTLYALTQDQKVESRLKELVKVTCYKIIQPTGYAHFEFLDDWRPFASPAVSYGHDLETAWLVMDALHALGDESNQDIIDIIKTVASNSANWGYDTENGGYFYQGPPVLQPTERQKIWWVQAEALLGLWFLFETTEEEKWLLKLEGTLLWILNKQKDHTHGEWYQSILPDGLLGDNGSNKGDAWKANYHTVRALTYTSQRINQFLKQHSTDREIDFE